MTNLTPRRAAATLLIQALHVTIDSMHADADDFCLARGISDEDRAAMTDAMAKVAGPFLSRLRAIAAGCSVEQLDHPSGRLFDRYDDEIPAFKPFQPRRS